MTAPSPNANGQRLGTSQVLTALAPVGAIVLSALGFGWWFSQQLSGFRLEFVEFKSGVDLGMQSIKGEVRGLREDLDGGVSNNEFRVWIESARQKYPDLPPFPRDSRR